MERENQVEYERKTAKCNKGTRRKRIRIGRACGERHGTERNGTKCWDVREAKETEEGFEIELKMELDEIGEGET